MGTGIRVFIVEDDDRLRRISEKQFEGLRSYDPKTKPLPEYANRKIRYILAGIAFENREITEIFHIDYGYFKFDKNGRFDKEFRQLQQRSFMESCSFFNPSYKENNVIKAGHLFNMKRHLQEFIWTPTEEIKGALIDAILGVKPPVKLPPLRLV